MELCIIICPVCGTYIKTHTPLPRACPRCGNRLVDFGRQQILEEAAKCIGMDRNEQYGEPENSFKTIAAMWTVYLNGRSVISAADVAAMMALLKTARISGGQAKADNWIDIAGYAACGGEIQEKAQKSLNNQGEMRYNKGVATNATQAALNTTVTSLDWKNIRRGFYRLAI